MGNLDVYLCTSYLIIMVVIRYVVFILSYRDHYHDVTTAREKRFNQIKPYIADRDFVKQVRKNKKIM